MITARFCRRAPSAFSCRPLLSWGKFRSFSSAAASPSSSGSSSSSAPDDIITPPAAPPVKRQFQAETTKLLNIVANSLYSDKEVFCRELVSNAADAMEKLRHALLSADSSISTSSSLADSSMEISITVDKEAKTFTIQDSGIGMSEAEMVDYLGTIARSGSKSFVDALDGDKSSSAESKGNIIGQFGVGFYSAYMVGDNVVVYSRSAVDGSKGYRWESDGMGSYTITEDDSAQVGTKIVIHLKEDCMEFADRDVVEGIIKKYSNFVSFPIKLNSVAINTIQPLWTMDSSSITDKQHQDFYRYIGKAWDSYQYKLHYKADAPVHINTLLYVPERNTETLGIGRMESGVSLYSRRVLIKGKAQQLLPDYLRFMRGVVESDDIPMNLSREMLQNSALISKLSDILTGKILRWLHDESKRDVEKYSVFYKDFGVFLKEGICTGDQRKQKDLAKLLRFESSASEPATMTSLADYVARKKDGQDKIFYMITSTRQWAEESPYLESFKKEGLEVLYMMESIDEFVVERLPEFDGMKLMSIDSSEGQAVVRKDGSDDASNAVTEDEGKKITEWFKTTLGKSVSDVKLSTGQKGYPALITDHESPTLRRLMKMTPQKSAMFLEEAPQKLQVNPEHPIIASLSKLIASKEQEELAKDITHQIFDNALIAAGIMDDPKVMLKRLNRLMEHSLPKL